MTYCNGNHRPACRIGFQPSVSNKLYGRVLNCRSNTKTYQKLTKTPLQNELKPMNNHLKTNSKPFKKQIKPTKILLITFKTLRI